MRIAKISHNTLWITESSGVKAYDVVPCVIYNRYTDEWLETATMVRSFMEYGVEFDDLSEHDQAKIYEYKLRQ